jgi:hypothetical protein
VALKRARAALRGDVHARRRDPLLRRGHDHASTRERPRHRDAAGSPALDARLREHVGCASIHFQPIASEFGVRGVLALCWNEPLAEVDSARAHLIEVLAHEASIAISRTTLPPARIAR